MKHITPILFGGALVLPALVLAQPSFTGHYPIGVEGLKSGTLPPPGFYLRDYNLVYYADRLNDASGKEVPIDFEAFGYANAIRPIWITDFKILGASYGLDVLVPFIYKNVSVMGGRDEDFNLGDIFIEPITLSWHWQQADAGIGYGLWAPTGNPDPAGFTGGTGQGTWTHMMTAGGTLYFDQKKTWAFSALGRYEINYESSDYEITPGNALSIEGGLSKALSPTFELGVMAYYQAQTTRDAGSDGVASSADLDSVVAVGPEFVWLWKQAGMFVSVRYGYEVMSEDRPQGHTGTITLTKRF
jgi:hypothetical protein